VTSLRYSSIVIGSVYACVWRMVENCGEVIWVIKKGTFQELYVCFSYSNILIKTKVMKMEALLFI